MNNTRHRFAILLLLSSFILHPSSFLLAQVPALINYQGRLVDGTNLFNGSARLQFHIFTNASGGSAVFSSTNLATVSDGVYATLIGQYVTAGSLNEVLTNRTAWLEVRVNGTTLTPRERLVSAPYALKVHGLDVSDANSIALGAPAVSNSITPGLGFATIGGGRMNRIEFGAYGTIGGGDANAINAGGGWHNTIGGGSVNQIAAGAVAATIGGGFFNIIRPGGEYATIPGGRENWATNYAFAAGRRAKAVHTGSFVWGDSLDADVSSTANNQVTFRASGGFEVLNGVIGARQGLSVGGGNALSRLQSGTAVLGAGTNVATYAVAFPQAFSSAPKVVVTTRNDPLFNVNDTFVATVRAVTTTNFVVNIVRVDSSGPWAQQLRADWLAWE